MLTLMNIFFFIRYLYTLYGEGIALSSLTQKDFEALELKFNSNRGCEFERMEFGNNNNSNNNQ